MKTTKFDLKPLLIALPLGLVLAACGRNEPEPVDTAPQSNVSLNEPAPPSAAYPNDNLATPSDPASADLAAAERSTGQVVDDGVITTKVKSKLLADDTVKGLMIDVDTRNAEVTLSGQVESQKQIDLAQQLAQSVEGVTTVHNELSVKPKA